MAGVCSLDANQYENMTGDRDRRCMMHISLIPSFLDDRESLFERAILHDDFAEPFHEGPQSRFGHSRDQFVEHAALAEERMGAMLGGVGLEMAVHAETFSGGAEQRQENDREGVEEKQPVAPLGVRDSQDTHPHA